MPSKIILFLFLALFPTVLLAEEFNHITIKEIDGRSWLADSHGNPFFAHGITHARNLSAKLDYRKFSKACKKLGFNAYGYGCPPELRSDMPYLEGWNHLVPISYYRGDGSHKYVDVFDPKVKARLETGVRAACLRNRNTSSNLIGYCWTDLASWPLENPAKKNWVDFIRSLPPNAPGRKAYQNFLGSMLLCREQDPYIFSTLMVETRDQ